MCMRFRFAKGRINSPCKEQIEAEWEGMFFLEQPLTVINKLDDVNKNDGIAYSEKQARINSCPRPNMQQRGQVKPPKR